MRPFLFAISTICAALQGQGHSVSPSEGLKSIAFMKGDWAGKQEFNTGGPPMTGSVVARIQDAIGGRYLEESLSTTVPGRPASDTRHFLTYDPKEKLFRAWWFNDSSVGAMELQGSLEGTKLILESKPTRTAAGSGTLFRATYERIDANDFMYSLEMKQGENWRLLFKTTYKRANTQ